MQQHYLIMRSYSVAGFQTYLESNGRLRHRFRYIPRYVGPLTACSVVMEEFSRGAMTSFWSVSQQRDLREWSLSENSLLEKMNRVWLLALSYNKSCWSSVSIVFYCSLLLFLFCSCILKSIVCKIRLILRFHWLIMTSSVFD